MEVERTARLQLADAARKVKEELDATVFELASFRRASQQSFDEGVAQTKEYATRIMHTVFEDLEKLPERSAAPIQTASKNTEEAIAKLAEMLSDKLKKSGETLSSEETKLTTSAAGVREALASIEQRLRAMQTPEGIIEIKLQPFVSSLTKAINAFSSITDRQLSADKEHQERLEKIFGNLQVGVDSLSQKITASAGENEKLQQGLVDRLSTAEETQRRILAELQQKTSNQADVAPAVASKGWFSRGLPDVRS
jgi:hypothetical protein